MFSIAAKRTPSTRSGSVQEGLGGRFHAAKPPKTLAEELRGMRIYPVFIVSIAKWMTPLVFALTPMLAHTAPMIIQTTGGPVPADQTGLMLPHEHIVTDLRGGTSKSISRLRVGLTG